MVMATAGVTRVDDTHAGHDGINVGKPERVVSMLSGGALALLGLQRRGLGGLSLALLGAELVRRGATGHCRLYDAMGMSTATDDGTPAPRARGELVSDAATVDARRSIKIERSITIDKPRDAVYEIWRDFAGLASYFPDLESVTTLGNGRSHWVAIAPGGKRVEWDSELVNVIPGELIAWKTVGDSDISHAGSVHFKDAPGGRGTEMRVEVDYEPPGGRLGALLTKFAGVFHQSPDAKIREDLRRFKMQLETGEVATTEGQVSGR
jgi:uncharacterized membrane protein